MDNRAFILLGSNLGDKRKNLIHAKQNISRNVGAIITESSIYKTSPWGKHDQPDFFNQVIEIATSLTPKTLLKEILAIEQDIGRIREESWGSRLIDIDILFYNELILRSNELTIPHSQIQNRRFTLIPLMEIVPGFIHPVLQKSIRELLDECPDPLSVEKL